MKSRQLSWGTVRAEFRAPARTTMEIERLFSPWVIFSDFPHAADLTVHVEVIAYGSARFDGSELRAVRLHAALHGLGQRQGNRVLLRNDHVDGWYELSAGRVRLIYPGEPDIFDVSQVLRSVLVEAGLRAGGQLIHAAVVVLGRAGVLLTGPKGAGKTSSLLAFLRAGAAFVSNDKALLLDRTVIGVPQAISASPWVRESLGGYPCHRSVRSVAGKELFFPAEMDPVPPTAGSAAVEALVDVRARAGSDVHLRRCGPEEIHAAQRHIVQFENGVHGSWVSGLFETPLLNRSWLARLDVPWLHLSFDPWNGEKVDRCLAGLASIVADENHQTTGR